MRRLPPFIVLLACAMPTVACHASEKDELALVMRQLDQVQAGLWIRFRRALTAPAWWLTRIRIPAFTSTISISTYLEPSRAQPNTGSASVSGQYRAQEPAWR